MVKKVMKSADGMYHIKGQKFELLKGSRAQVWHGTAYKTKGDLKKADLYMNKHGRIVSKKKHTTIHKKTFLYKISYFYPLWGGLDAGRIGCEG